MLSETIRCRHLLWSYKVILKDLSLGYRLFVPTSRSRPVFHTITVSVVAGCSLLSLKQRRFVVTMWHQERTSRPNHGRGFVGGNYS
jgi:hypothetical protein